MRKISVRSDEILFLRGHNLYEGNRELNELRLLLQRKHHALELCVRLSVSRLFRIGHVLHHRRCLALIGFHTKTKNERFILPWCRVVVRTSQMKISRRHLADIVIKLHQKAYRTCSTITFLRSTNQSIDLWRCHCSCRLKLPNREL